MNPLRVSLPRRLATAGVALTLLAACGTARSAPEAVVTPSDAPPPVASGEGAGVPEASPSPYASGLSLSSPAATRSPSSKPTRTSFWGEPVVENFDGPLSDEWGEYDTPDGTPPRSGDQVSVSGGMLHIAGGVNERVGKDVGGGVMFLRDLKYGRWEVRFRVQAGAGYSAVVLLWPKENADWPAAGEIDLAEITNPARASFGSFLHHGKDNHKVGTDTKADFTKFHTIAVDWLPNRVTYYLDGKKFFNVTPGQIETGLPTESVMHLALQLDQGCDDFIPCRTAETPKTVMMDVDWVKVYRAP
ncbi:family 16 glycosylhydrolase [Actinoplanes sp. NPDC051513]|uniref:glycoside hydrolase family 16 protein n=1 Tax=Actinoplanes sp. NPDC051513 TaxID=3363908 RepID=UPI00379F3147